jgi:hypothetical protein
MKGYRKRNEFKGLPRVLTILTIFDDDSGFFSDRLISRA